MRRWGSLLALGLLLAFGGSAFASSVPAHVRDPGFWIASCCKNAPTPAPVTPLSVQVLTDAALQAACTNTTSCPNGHAVFAQGVWRVGFYAEGDVAPTFWSPQTGTCASHNYPSPNNAVAVVADHIYCSAAADGNSWISPPRPGADLDAMQSGLLSTGDGTAAAQSVLNVAYYLGGGSVHFPLGFHYSTILWPSIVRVTCAGRNNPMVRTAVGPGWTTTDAPTNAYPVTPLTATYMRDCDFNDFGLGNSGLAGFNITFTEMTGSSLIENVHSYSKMDGIEFTGQLSAGNTVNVVAIDGGNMVGGAVGTGMLILCAGDGSPAGCLRDDAIDAVATQALFPRVTSGSGGIAVYNTTSHTQNVTQREMVGSVSWQWTAAPGSPILPSAAMALIGGTFDSQFNNIYAGGVFKADASHCDYFTGIGLYTATFLKGEKPNANRFIQLYTPCARLGKGLADGADGVYIGTDEQFDNYAWMIGFGPVNASRTTIFQPYIEGAPSTPEITEVGFGLGQSADGTRVFGSGSTNGTVTYMKSYNNSSCWALYGVGKNTFTLNRPVDQLYCPGFGPPMVTGSTSDVYQPTQKASSVDAVSAGGTGYVTNDTYTPAGGSCTTPPVLTVTAAAGVVTSAVISTPGVCAQRPGNVTTEIVTQGSTSGSGVGATFQMTFINIVPAPPAGVIAAEKGFWWYANTVFAELGTCDITKLGLAYMVSDNATAIAKNATIAAGSGNLGTLGICTLQNSSYAWRMP